MKCCLLLAGLMLAVGVFAAPRALELAQFIGSVS